MTPRRFWFDVSYTRHQQGSIGITRTVRRLAGEFRSRPGGTVAFHSTGWRQVPFPEVRQQAPEDRMQPRSWRQRLFRFVTTGAVARWLVLGSLKFVPWILLKHAWERASRLLFDGLSADAPPAHLGPGDTLVIADVCWDYPVWHIARMARASGVAVVLVVHDLMPLRRPQFCFPLVPKVFGTCLREMTTYADAIVCNSRATEDDLRAWASEQGLGLPATGHFRLGCDGLAPVANEPVRPAVSSFLASSAPCFVAVGTFEPKKNYPTLVRAFERLWRQGLQVRLLIAGRETVECGDFTQALRQHPEQGQRLLTVHDANDAEVQAAYTGCRALVFPSLFEGFGLPLVEARTRGCRVIASRIPAFEELADSGVMLFNPQDEVELAEAVRSLILAPGEDPGVMPLTTWADSARQLEDVIHQLLDQP